VYEWRLTIRGIPSEMCEVTIGENWNRKLEEFIKCRNVTTLHDKNKIKKLIKRMIQDIMSTS
jgi:hypothetical protein